jgi:hypothetical protein
MINYIVGFICGIVIASVGFTGVAKVIDNGIDTIKNTTVSLESKK